MTYDRRTQRVRVPLEAAPSPFRRRIDAAVAAARDAASRGADDDEIAAVIAAVLDDSDTINQGDDHA